MATQRKTELINITHFLAGLPGLPGSLQAAYSNDFKLIRHQFVCWKRLSAVALLMTYIVRYITAVIGQGAELLRRAQD